MFTFSGRGSTVGATESAGTSSTNPLCEVECIQLTMSSILLLSFSSSGVSSPSDCSDLEACVVKGAVVVLPSAVGVVLSAVGACLMVLEVEVAASVSVEVYIAQLRLECITKLVITKASLSTDVLPLIAKNLPKMKNRVH